MKKGTLLILSFTSISRDARVLKQVRLFSKRYRVITCSYGPAPEGVAEHIQIPEAESISYMSGRLITLKMYSRVYWGVPAIRWAAKHLRGRRFDAILANDFESVPLALSLKPRCGVHADLHEYSPRQHEYDAAWARRITPYRNWVVRKHVSRADSWTTVCQGLADEYQKNFGFSSTLVTNATPAWDLQPRPVHNPVRLVHHGNANAARGIDWMIEAFMATTAEATFDLYLQDPHLRQIPRLRELAGSDDRVRVHEAVPYHQLLPLLNEFDVGLSTILPNTFNLKHALPNKIFDYVQARLGIITGPSPEMARLVKDYDLGVVLPDFDRASLAAAIDSLDAERILWWKNNADGAAEELSAEKQEVGWTEPIEELFAKCQEPKR